MYIYTVSYYLADLVTTFAASSAHLYDLYLPGSPLLRQSLEARSTVGQDLKAISKIEASSLF